MEMWEILVPTMRNDGRPIKTRFHRVWDSKVREIAGGLTIMSPVKGEWVSSNDKLFRERMIPVRIVCNKDDIIKIVDMTIEYYEQEAVLAYKISNDCIMRERINNSNICVKNPTKEDLNKLKERV